MNLIEAIKKINRDFESDTISQENTQKILDKIEEGHHIILTLRNDLNNFERLKIGSIFAGDIDNNKKGWMNSHRFPITLEILNKEKVPGGKVAIPSLGGAVRNLLVYHALCPELENFTSLIVWLISASSKNAWEQILKLINSADDSKVLEFSQKCGINLPNTIHPSHDRDSKLVEKKLYESLYDWRYAYYLFDDGQTIMSHNSPINFRRVILDEKTKYESFVDIRSTMGRVIAIRNREIQVSIPCLNGRPRKFDWQISKKMDKSDLKNDKLYFFQIYKIVGENNIETHIRNFEEAMPVDIIGMFLAQSMYLNYLGSKRLKLINNEQFEKLFLHYYQQVSRFCLRDSDEGSSMNKIDWKSIQFGYTESFTKWIDYELYFLPPLLRRFMSNNNFDLEVKEHIIQKCDDALKNGNKNCVEKNSYTDSGKRIFRSNTEIGKLNNMYHFIHFLLKSKRFIFGIEKNPNQQHNREIEIEWLQNKFMI